MAEGNFIDDVRAAKAWVESQSSSFQEHGEWLREIGRQYEARTGPFANVPRERPAWVRAAIDAAEDDPGHEAIDEFRRMVGRS